MPLVNMPFVGRLGNLLFQYAWLRAWAEQNGYELCLAPWIGERVFAGVPEAVRPDKHKPDLQLKEDLCQQQERLIYTRKQVREWFRFKNDVLEKLQPAKSDPNPEIAILNVRRDKDYVAADMAMISLESYLEAHIERFGEDAEAEWEWDTNPRRLDSFTGDFSSSGLGTTEVCLPSFYRLMTAPILFRANSTFSWFAATLGNGRIFSPIVKGMKTGVPNQHCSEFVEGNWPAMTYKDGFTDLHLRDE